MTTNDVRRPPADEPVGLPHHGSAAVPISDALPAAESLTSPVLPAASPTTTPLAPDVGTGAQVSAELELAAELADELAMVLERHGDVEPEETPPPARPPHVEIWVDAGDVLARLGLDGWAEFDELDGRVRALHDELGPHDERTLAAIGDRDAVDALSRQDEAAYQVALAAAVREIAAERGLDVEVLPVRMARDAWSDGPGADLDDLLVAAVGRAVLPQLGHAPHDLPLEAVAGAVRAAHRTYRERVRDGERPAPAVGHDHLEEELRTELRADELMPDAPEDRPQ